MKEGRKMRISNKTMKALEELMDQATREINERWHWPCTRAELLKHYCEADESFKEVLPKFGINFSEL